jgi:hypothetical protein
MADDVTAQKLLRHGGSCVRPGRDSSEATHRAVREPGHCFQHHGLDVLLVEPVEQEIERGVGREVPQHGERPLPVGRPRTGVVEHPGEDRSGVRTGKGGQAVQRTGSLNDPPDGGRVEDDLRLAQLRRRRQQRRQPRRRRVRHTQLDVRDLLNDLIEPLLLGGKQVRSGEAHTHRTLPQGPHTLDRVPIAALVGSGEQRPQARQPRVGHRIDLVHRPGHDGGWVVTDRGQQHASLSGEAMTVRADPVVSEKHPRVPVVLGHDPQHSSHHRRAEGRRIVLCSAPPTPSALQIEPRAARQLGVGAVVVEERSEACVRRCQQLVHRSARCRIGLDGTMRRPSPERFHLPPPRLRHSPGVLVIPHGHPSPLSTVERKVQDRHPWTVPTSASRKNPMAALAEDSKAVYPACCSNICAPKRRPRITLPALGLGSRSCARSGSFRALPGWSLGQHAPIASGYAAKRTLSPPRLSRSSRRRA